MSTLIISRKKLDALFLALKAKSCQKWPEARMREKIALLPSMTLPELDEEEQAEEHATLDALLAAVEDETVDDLVIGEEEAPGKTAVNRKKIKKQVKTTEVEPPAKAPAKKGAVPKTPAKTGAAKESKAPKGKAPKEPKKPGVIDTILSLLQEASEKKPVTKETIVAKLAKAFPDREPDSMAKTVNVQVPTRLGKDKGVQVHKNENGYWVG